MKALLLKLNYGLGDLSYMELERHEAVGGGGTCNRRDMRSQKKAVFYTKLFNEDHEFQSKGRLNCIPLHVHKFDGRTKLAGCSLKQRRLRKICSIGEDLERDFLLDISGTLTSDKLLDLQINGKSVYDQDSTEFKLKHGDIIEGFYFVSPFFRVMFILADGSPAEGLQTSPLLSLPHLIFNHILSFLTPLETMNNVVPVCRTFFEMMRSGDVWTNLEFSSDFGQTSVPYNYMEDFRKVLAGRARKFVVNFTVQSFHEPMAVGIMRPLLSEPAEWKNLKWLEIHSMDCDDPFWVDFLQNEKLSSQFESLVIPCGRMFAWQAGIMGSGFNASSQGEIIFPNCLEVALLDVFPGNLMKIRPNLSLVFPRLKRLHFIDPSEFGVVTRHRWGIDDDSSSADFQRFLDILGSGVLVTLHARELPVTWNEEDWVLAQGKGTFTSLESLSLPENPLEEMSDLVQMNILFPKLKTLWLTHVKTIRSVNHLLEMPSLEKLWLEFNALAVPEMEPELLRVFDASPEKWLANLKFISADLWETHVPYSKMSNLECVALLFYHKEIVTRPLETVYEELNSCPKLKGLILRVHDDLHCEAIKKLSQPLEFAAVSGIKSMVVSALKCLSQSQTRLEEVWIRVLDADKTTLDTEITMKKDMEEILELLLTFKRLKNVVFIRRKCYEERELEFEGLENKTAEFGEMLKTRVPQESCLKQATLLLDVAHDKESYTYSVELQREKEFSSVAISKFFPEWLKYIWKDRKNCSFSAIGLLAAVFPWY
ncbi:unnamed protein product [Notodromas monacha]|uniref:F-box domain-containing protein n=1 Tax=Notodromas monacha TaxID=399045 RepID=A0A7R9BT75_9CRUS|nr:unnamed protein product [Notodromas monacha]CAG0919679.1 unnamed protein product [Notodromas monacha]